MGSSPEANLIYGVDLGGADGDWKVKETGEYGSLALPWVREDDDFKTEAMKVLLAMVGFTETDRRADGFFERKSDAEARIGVKFRHTGSDGFIGLVLSCAETSVEWSDTKVLDLAELASLPVENGWDAKLAAALKALGITPLQERPAWLLCAYYG